MKSPAAVVVSSPPDTFSGRVALRLMLKDIRHSANELYRLARMRILYYSDIHIEIERA